ncbi:TetR/AcrR family transcriptional regulator [Actinosynnema pretiosum subsp. pretiosum]|uniref:Transcriptional regulator, TetR family n=2 Tax=Actinosynnema TaxID=40566 RepID=C6WRQ2_ACTMD|nr:TetR/AcrR family transcriptional regulator [Actinosynnema mirum]ACU36894.1 transcriptional regulator, TetR family [Actinosynnema mirum DSM 43827]AXX30363.1 regulatory protein, TetR [Actinosynnema pretiosum subsp. pretiosum]QUF05488.1 TetR/AcrR family transcriptional regulator [Actinosynnema pretiosum subsp. pretiosum]
MTGGYLKGRIRREDIITAAMELYGEVGYHGASLRETAKRVGISHAGLIYHFPTKESLLAAVLERRDAEDVEREQLTSGPPGARVLRQYLALTAHNAAHPGIVDLYSRLAAEATSPDHPAHEYFVQHYRGAREGVLESFEVLAASGGLRDGVEPKSAALVFIALMDGLQVQWLTSPEDVDLVGVLRAHLRTVLADPLDLD